MPNEQSQTLIVGTSGDAREIRYLVDPAPPGAAGIFWLSGFMSDMRSTKASALVDYARTHGLGATRFDYSGHGASGGEFEHGTISRWLEEAVAVFRLQTAGRQIVVGSSMGGYIALLLLRELMRDAPEDAARIAGLVLVAPAWDMTEELMWKKFSKATQDEIMTRGSYERPSAYDAPYTITKRLIEDGRRNLLAREPLDPRRPVYILQGLQDVDVPAAHTRQLMKFLVGDDVHLIEIVDGEHRLSRPEDLERLFSAVAVIAAQ